MPAAIGAENAERNERVMKIRFSKKRYLRIAAIDRQGRWRFGFFTEHIDDIRHFAIIGQMIERREFGERKMITPAHVAMLYRLKKCLGLFRSRSLQPVK